MKNFILMRLLKYAGGKLDGKKTYAGGIGKILVGLGTMISGIVALIGIAFPDQGLPAMDLETALGLIAGGFYAISSGLEGIGIGHKIEKSAGPTIEVKPAPTILDDEIDRSG